MPRITLFVMSRVALLGGGKMGAALVGGLLDGGYDPDSLAVAEIDAERRRELEARFPKVRVVPSAAWAVADADVVVVAVKPGDVAASLAAALDALPRGRARAVDRGGRDDRDARSERARPAGRPGDAEHARARRAGCRRRSRRARPRPRSTSSWPTALLRSVGIVVRVAEPQLDAVTGLSGSGPAYVMLVAEALTEAGVLVGSAPPDRRASSSNRRCWVRPRCSPRAMMVRKRCGPRSRPPGGTTAAGLRELEARGVRAAFLDAVAAATRTVAGTRTKGRRARGPSEVGTMKARNRPPRLDAPARGAAARAASRRPRSCSCGPRIAGKVTSPGPRELRHQVERLDANPVEAWAAIRAVFGATRRGTADRPDVHDPCRHGSRRARIGAVARAGGRIAFATAQPASLLGVHGALVLAGPARAAGRSTTPRTRGRSASTGAGRAGCAGSTALRS